MGLQNGWTTEWLDCGTEGLHIGWTAKVRHGGTLEHQDCGMDGFQGYRTVGLQNNGTVEQQDFEWRYFKKAGLQNGGFFGMFFF